MNSKMRVPSGFEEVVVFLNRLYMSWSVSKQEQPAISLRWSTGGDLVRGRYEPRRNKIYCICSRLVDVPITIKRPIGTKQGSEGTFTGVTHSEEIRDYVEAAIFVLGAELWRWLVRTQRIVGDARDTKANRVGFVLLKIFRDWKELRLERFPEPLELLELSPNVKEEEE